MSELAKRLFEGIQSVTDTVMELAPGLENLVPDVKAELARLGTQGSMELSAVLFHQADAFVPYGPGQYTPSIEHEPAPELEMEHER